MRDQLEDRHTSARRFRYLCMISTWVGVVLLAILLFSVTIDGLEMLSLDFLRQFPSRVPEDAGIYSAIMGTLWMISLTALISIPIGVGAAIYLEEYAGEHWLITFIELNISNLAGVPSIVYGLLGLAVFVRFFSLQRSVISGSLTMSLLILPIIIISSREALRAVPDTVRKAAFALGATRWQTIWYHVLPASLPGIITGIILSISRAIGETAPLIMIGALTYVAFVPKSIFDQFTALPIQIFNWAARPQEEFHQLAASGIIVLLTILLLMNAVAVYIRHRFHRKNL